jgi:hypothetical protein
MTSVTVSFATVAFATASSRETSAVGRGRAMGPMMTKGPMTMASTRARDGRCARARRGATVTRARGGGGGGGGDDDGSASSLLDALEDACPVPRDQRPASQYEELRDGALLSWPGLGVAPYAVRMTGLFGFFYGVIAYPIACGSYDPNTQFAETCVSALVGASGATAAMALNMYNGWSYVRDRLLSATVEYEETGWYDGQVYVKDPEMLARDRLLGTYTVRPVVEMLRKTLLGCGAVALISLAALRTIDAPNGEMNGDYGSNMGYYSQTSAEEEDEDEEAMRLMMMQSMGAPAASAPAAESDASVGEDE